MARNKILNDEAFWELHNLMNDMPKKKGETWIEYAARVNKRSVLPTDYSTDTLSRVRKANDPEEYKKLIDKKHPKKKNDPQVLQLEIPISRNPWITVKDEDLRFEKLIEAIETLTSIWNEINESMEAKKNAADE